MPASLKRIKETGGLVLLHLCDAEDCAAEASFGRDVSLRRALKSLDLGDAAAAKRHLGRWYCSSHRPAPEKERP